MDTFKELGTKGAIKKLYEGCGFDPIACPCYESAKAYSVMASRLFLEGIDFDLTFFPFKHLGYKAVLGVTGELFSKIATPKTLRVIIGVSSKLDYPQVAQIWEGVCSAAKEYGYLSLSLDLIPSLTGLSISVSATGSVPLSNASSNLGEGKSKISCSQPQSMDLICISNNAGAAFLGEQILRKSKDLPSDKRDKQLEKYKQLIGAYLKPELSPFTLKALKESKLQPSLGYFCTKGLSDTINQLISDSGLGAKIYVDKLPFAGGSIDAAKELGVDPLQAALKGGDDNILLFTIPIGDHDKFRHDFQSWDVIGHLAKPEVGAVLVSPDGLEHSF